jgi:hypothetical protein
MGAPLTSGTYRSRLMDNPRPPFLPAQMPLYHYAPRHIQPVAPAAASAAQGEPSSKRRRLENPPQGKSLKECLKTHLLPYIASATQKLPPWCRKRPIAEEVSSRAQGHICKSKQANHRGYQTIVRIATSPDFRIRRERTGGNLTPEDEAYFAEKVTGVVREFARDPVCCTGALPLTICRLRVCD